MRTQFLLLPDYRQIWKDLYSFLGGAYGPRPPVAAGPRARPGERRST